MYVTGIAMTSVVCYRYRYDVTLSMFSAGNITEKLRVAGFDCRGETVVDMFAGRWHYSANLL